MNVSIVVATYGSMEWANMGNECAAKAREHDAFSVVNVHLHDGTLAEARNLGAEDATGDWLCFLDADDELAPGYLEEMAAAFPGGDRWLLTPAVQYVRGRVWPRPKIWPAMDLRNGNYLVIGTLVPRAVFEEVGGFREWPMYEDWCLWQRCWKAGCEVVEVPDAVYVAHARPRSRNRSATRNMKVRVHREIVAANFPGHPLP
jgi:glycosyltransferase involved in cell wall biosynthesis